MMRIKCECGGTFRPVRIDEFDFSALAGLPVTILNVAGLRCGRCGGETLSGEVISDILERVALTLVRQDARLRAEQARYLRKRLGLTQRELAVRMGLNRQTVAKWETARESISPQNDMVLRALVLGAMPRSRHLPELIAAILEGVRRKAPLRRIHALRVSGAA